MENVISEVREFLGRRRLLKSTADVGDEASLLETGVIDSLAVIELVTFLEERFAIQVHEDDLVPENFDSFRAIGEFVTRKGR